MIVGVNRYVQAEDTPIETHRVDPAGEAQQVARLRAVRAGRDSARVEGAHRRAQARVRGRSQPHAGAHRRRPRPRDDGRDLRRLARGLGHLAREARLLESHVWGWPDVRERLWDHDRRMDSLRVLSGIAVVNAGVNLPVMAAAARLAELGASVTKVEPPGGDPSEALAGSLYRRPHRRPDRRPPRPQGARGPGGDDRAARRRGRPAHLEPAVGARADGPRARRAARAPPPARPGRDGRARGSAPGARRARPHLRRPPRPAVAAGAAEDAARRPRRRRAHGDRGGRAAARARARASTTATPRSHSRTAPRSSRASGRTA